MKQKKQGIVTKFKANSSFVALMPIFDVKSFRERDAKGITRDANPCIVNDCDKRSN